MYFRRSWPGGGFSMKKSRFDESSGMNDSVVSNLSRTIEADRLKSARDPILGYPTPTLFYAPSGPLDHFLTIYMFDIYRNMNDHAGCIPSLLPSENPGCRIRNLCAPG